MYAKVSIIAMCLTTVGCSSVFEDEQHQTQTTQPQQSYTAKFENMQTIAKADKYFAEISKHAWLESGKNAIIVMKNCKIKKNEVLTTAKIANLAAVGFEQVNSCWQSAVGYNLKDRRFKENTSMVVEMKDIKNRSFFTKQEGPGELYPTWLDFLSVKNEVATLIGVRRAIPSYSPSNNPIDNCVVPEHNSI